MKFSMMKRATMTALAAVGAMIGAAPAEAAVRYQFSGEGGSFNLLLDDFVSPGAFKTYAAPAGSTCLPGYASCTTIHLWNDWEGSDYAFIGDDNSQSGTGFLGNAFDTVGTHISNFGNNTLIVSQVGAAPEPATWAMLILGFGLAGWALRRRGAARPAAATARSAFA